MKIQLIKKLLTKKLYIQFPFGAWNQKKKQTSNINKYKKIIVFEDHLKDGGLQSWLNESNNKLKIQSRSLDKKVISKVGSQSFLMKYLKEN